MGGGLSLGEDCSNPLQFLGRILSFCVLFCRSTACDTDHGHVSLGTAVGTVVLGCVSLASLLETLYIIDRRADSRHCSRVGQLRFCSISSTQDVLWYLRETNRASCVCTASVREIPFLVTGSQTVLAYSRSGLTS